MRREAGQITARILQDIWVEATAAYWRRRADQLEAARPRRGDFNGNATAADIVEAHRRLTEAADACRNRATWLEAGRSEFTTTLHDVASPAEERILLAERRLREAIDQDHQPAIRWWSNVLDQLEREGALWAIVGAAA